MSDDEKRVMTCPQCGGILLTTGKYGEYRCLQCGVVTQYSDQVAQGDKQVILDKRFSHKERLKDKEYAFERHRLKYEAHKDWRDILNTLVTTGMGPLLLLLVISIGGMFITGLLGQRANSKLEQIEKQVVQAIREENYTDAMLFVNQLRYSGDSKDKEKSWSAKREEYTRIIDEKREEAELRDPDNIFMPADSGYYIGKNYEIVAENLISLGFLNISAQKSVYTADLFHGENNVESLVFNGKTSFKKGDHFRKDVTIILYYYYK